MTIRANALLLAFALGSGLLPAAQDGEKKPTPAGQWVLTIPGPNGEPVEMKMEFAGEGGMLTGALVLGETRRLPIENGSFKDGTMKFQLKRPRASGETVVYDMSGTLDGDKIKGRAATEFLGQRVEIDWDARRIR
jgi:hypothetical protein